MVGTHVAAFFLRPFKHWPVNNPKEIEFIVINQVKLFGNTATKGTKRCIGYLKRIRYKENQVLIFKTKRCYQVFLDASQELGNWSVQFSIHNLNPSKALSSILLGYFGHLVDVFT